MANFAQITLAELAKKHGTDKVEHGYCPHYEARFGSPRNQPITLLEIGSWHGQSLRMWRDYFPLGKIVSFDQEPVWLPTGEDRITLEIGRQEDTEFQINFGRRHGPFDIVIDDGGHYAHQHLTSYKALWRFVKPGGWYAIEDCHTLFNEHWTQPAERTILELLHDRRRQILLGECDTGEVHLVGGRHNDGLLLLRKRSQEELDLLLTMP
jgi:hypothetical protein